MKFIPNFRSENPEIYSEVPQIVEYERNGNCNLVQGYATCCHLGAYEKRTSQNGLYVQHLAKFLDKNLPITQILQLAHLGRVISALTHIPLHSSL